MWLIGGHALEFDVLSGGKRALTVREIAFTASPQMRMTCRERETVRQLSSPEMER
jgi:hypothetical protein